MIGDKEETAVIQSAGPGSIDEETQSNDGLTDAGDKGGRPACFRSTVQECVFVLTTTMAIGQSSFFTGMNIGISASIGETLNMTSAEITWITAGASYV